MIKANADTVPQVCDIFNPAKMKPKMYPLNSIPGRQPLDGEKQLCKVQERVKQESGSWKVISCHQCTVTWKSSVKAIFS